MNRSTVVTLATPLLNTAVRMLDSHRKSISEKPITRLCECVACLEARAALSYVIGCDASEVMDYIEADGQLHI